jgi:hypothetical protein
MEGINYSAYFLISFRLLAKRGKDAWYGRYKLLCNMLRTRHSNQQMLTPTVGTVPLKVLLDLFLAPVPELGCAPVSTIFLKQRGLGQIGPERKHTSKRSNCGSNIISWGLGPGVL